MLTKNIFWSLSGQAIQLGISFITNIVLARMLSSYEFGQLGIVMFFISIANIFVDGGLGGALVRKQDSTDNDYATVFTMNFLISIILYSLIYISSDKIAHFYGDSHLSTLFKVAFLVIIFNSFSLTQNTRLVAAMNFKLISICKIIAVLISSIVAFIIAYKGYGVWALIFMQIIYAFVNSLLLNFFNGIYFKFFLSKSSIKELYAYGLNLSFASLLTTAFDNIYQMIIGKYFSISLTGLYYQGKKLQEVPVNVLNISLQGPIFSFLSKKQSNIKEFIEIYDKINRLAMLVVGLLTVIVFSFSEHIIMLVYGYNWLGAAQFMSLLSLASFFFLMEMCNRVIFKVFDKTKFVLYLEIVKKAIQTIGILVGIYYKSIEYLLIAFVISSCIGYLINLFFSRKVLMVSGKNDFILLFKTLILIAITSFLTHIVLTNFSFGSSIDLFYISITTLIYLLLSFALNILNFKSVWHVIRTYIIKKSRS